MREVTASSGRRRRPAKHYGTHPVRIGDLVSLTGKEFDAAFGWVDWHSSEQEVVEAFESQLGDGWALQLKADDERSVLSVQGADHTVPLTGTGSDRYVMLSSLAEIFKETHVVWLHKGRIEDDTHGVLVLTKEQSDALMAHHAAWVAKHLLPLEKGVDEFRGIAIPYYGHEDNAPGFEEDCRAMDRARTAQQAKIKADAEKYLDRYVALEEAANRKSLVQRFGFPVTIAILVLIAVVIALAPN